MENFTQKAQEALQNSQVIAQEYGQENITVLHLLKALLEQKDTVVASFLSAADMKKELLLNQCDNKLVTLPKVAKINEF